MLLRRCWFLFVASLVIAGSGWAQYWTRDASFAPVLEGTDVPDAPWIMAGAGGTAFVSAYTVNGIGAGRGAVRLMADGTVDATFNFPPGSWATLAVYPDGKVLAQQSVANDDWRVTRLLPDGSVDSTFTAISVSDRVKARVLNDGRILLFGYLTQARGLPRNGLALLDSSGTLSTAFVPGLTSPNRVIVEDALPLPDGRIVVVGSFASAGTNSYNRIARLNPDGSIDSTFTPDSSVFLSNLYRSPVDGTLLAAWGSNQPSKQLVRLNASGIRDNTFTPELVGTVDAFGEQQPDGRIYYVTSNNGWELRRIHADGTADASFVVGLVRSSGLPTVAADGTLFVPDSVTTERRTQRFMVSRLAADGTLDANYRPRIGTRATVERLSHQPDGKVLVAGSFSSVSGTPQPGRTIVRLNADGSLDESFRLALATGEGVSTFALQMGEKIIATGTFLDGASRRTAMRFNADGSRDLSFRAIESTRTEALAIDATGRFYLQPQLFKLARYLPDGAVDGTFQSGNFEVDFRVPMAPFADGTVVVWPLSGNRLVRLRADGTIDSTFTPDPRSPFVSGLVALPDGRLVVSGITSVARLTRDGAADFVYVGREVIPTRLTEATLVWGGLMFDLLETANVPGTFQAFADQTTEHELRLQGAIRRGANGQLLTAVSSYPGTILERYTRTAAGGMTFDPKPFIMHQSRTQPFGSLQGANQTLTITAGGLFPLSYQWMKDGVPISGATSNEFTLESVQLGDAGVYTVAVSNAHGTATTTPMQLVVNHEIVPVTFSGPLANASTGMGGSAAFTVAAVGNPVPVVQWYFNGTPRTATSGWTQISNLSATTHSTLALFAIEIAHTGIYTAQASGNGAVATAPAILGITTAQKFAGTAQLVGADVTHPNGNIFDQVLSIGAAAAITADAGKVTRLSFIDLDDDIVQVELSGAGTLSLVFEAASGPAKPVKYTQDVLYMKGHAGIVVAGANETTNVTIFSVGRATAFDSTGAFNFLAPLSATNNPANNGSPLFQGQANTVYDGVADLAFVAISSTDGKFGGLRTANASYFATKGIAGVYAPGVNFSGPLFVGDIRAFDAATPMLVIGSSPDTRVTGGDLWQDNGRAVQVNGLTQLKFTSGGNSHGHPFAARTNLARLEQGGTDVTAAIVVNPTP